MERILREVLLPQAGREQVYLKSGMGIDPLEHIHEVDIGIDALQAARGNQALHDADIVGTDFRPAKQPRRISRST